MECIGAKRSEEWKEVEVLELRKMENVRNGICWSMEKWKTESLIKIKKAGIFCFEDFGFFCCGSFKKESGQFVSGSGIKLVPFFLREGDFCPFGDAGDACGIGCAYHHLHVGRMAQKPCYGYAVFCGIVFFCQTGQDSIQFGVAWIADECAFEYTILEGAVTLDGDMVPAAVIQHTGVTGDAMAVCGVQIGRGVQQQGVRQRKLQLVDLQRLFDTCFQKFYLAGRVVADTEMENFSLDFQLVKGFCHFFRFHE